MAAFITHLPLFYTPTNSSHSRHTHNSSPSRQPRTSTIFTLPQPKSRTLSRIHSQLRSVPRLQFCGNNNNNNNGDNNGNWHDDNGGNRVPPPHLLSVMLLSRATQNKPFTFRITHLLLFANIALFVLQTMYPPLLMQGAKLNPAIRSGEFYRLITPIFLHASTSHLLINAFSLHSTGPSVESWLGKKRFSLLYLTAGISGNILSYICTPTPAVGASGAIFGLVGATAVILARHRDLLGARARRGLQSLAYIVLLNFGMGLSPGSRIDNFGHLGGFLGGICFTYMFGPRLFKRRVAGGRIVVLDYPLYKQVLKDMRVRLRQVGKLVGR